MKKREAKLTIVVAMLLVIALYFVGGTYARYVGEASGNASVDVAKWAVKLNGTDLTATKGTISNLTFTETTNPNVVDGKIAPGKTLYTDFTIDPDGSDVAMDYSFKLGSITASGSPTVTVPNDIKVSKVVILGEGNAETTITSEDGEYKGTIALKDQTRLSSAEAVKIRVYITWENEENNTTDTTVGLAAPTLTMSVEFKASQKIS